MTTTTQNSYQLLTSYDSDLTQSTHQPCEAGCILCPLYRNRQLQHQEMKEFSRDHTAQEGEGRISVVMVLQHKPHLQPHHSALCWMEDPVTWLSTGALGERQEQWATAEAGLSPRWLWFRDSSQLWECRPTVAKPSNF